MATTVETYDRVTIDGEKVIVKEPCDSKTGGHWYCVYHNRNLANGIDKDNHIKATCRMAWICHDHGAEQP